MVEPSNTAPEIAPASVGELADAIRSQERLRVVGSNRHESFRLPPSSAATVLTTRELSGVVEFNPDDQVVVVRAGTPIHALQEVLMERGQCLPMVEWYDGYSPANLQGAGTVGGALSMNLPEYLEAECGTWRDWVLGVTVVLADGTVAKSGSRAVKNVAGYDLQKLFIGARGSLGVLGEVILRTYPVASLPKPRVQGRSAKLVQGSPSLWIQRVLPSDLAKAQEAASAYGGFDITPTATLWRFVPCGESLTRFPGDWVLRSGCGAENLRIGDPTLVRLMRRAKDLFDPGHKLNPGEMGIF